MLVHKQMCREYTRGNEVWQALTDLVARLPFSGHRLSQDSFEFLAKSPIPFSRSVPVIKFHYRVFYKEERVEIIKAKFERADKYRN